MSSNLSEVLAITLLLVVASALAWAATYAAFGHPSSREGKQRKQHIVNGFRLGGGIIAAFLVMSALIASVRVGIFGIPARFTSKTLALVLGSVSIAIIWTTVRRWGKYLAGWVGYSTIPALFAAFSGHLYGRSIPQSFSWTYVGISVLTVFASFRFTENYELNLAEKLALVIWVIGFAVEANLPQHYALLGLVPGCACLLIAWAYTRFKPRHARRHRATV